MSRFITAVITTLFPRARRAPVQSAQTSPHARQGRSFALIATDPDGDFVSYSLVDLPSHGTLSGAAPNLTYTPANGYLGSDRITFKASDGTLDSAVATVNINVNSSNTAPSALPQSVSTNEPAVISVTSTRGMEPPPTLHLAGASWDVDVTAPSLIYTPEENYPLRRGTSRQMTASSLPIRHGSRLGSAGCTPDPTAKRVIRRKQGESQSFILAQDLDGDPLTTIVSTHQRTSL